MESITLDLGGPTHLVDHGGSGTPLLLVHGLGASHHSWSEVVPFLTPHHRVMALDLVGHGLTPPGRRTATIDGHTTLVEDVIDALALGPVVLVGNSMGGLVSAVVAERSPHRVSGLVMIDPALPLASLSDLNTDVLVNIGVPLIPGLGPLAMRRRQASTSPAEHVDAMLELVTADPDRVSAEYRRTAAEMVEQRRRMPWAIDAVASSGRSMAKTLTRRRRVWRLFERIAVPVLVIHGTEDRLASVRSARRVAELRPEWNVRVLDDAGHAPQVEIPAVTAAVINGWVESHHEGVRHDP